MIKSSWLNLNNLTEASVHVWVCVGRKKTRNNMGSTMIKLRTMEIG